MPGTKAYKINEANVLIEKYDHAQMDAILGDMAGIQRIRDGRFRENGCTSKKSC